MKIVAFLQNQWWRDPEGVKKTIARSATPEKCRLRLIQYGLSICTTGKRLAKYLLPVIGRESWGDIHWENSSREIGGKSSSSFPADLEHMKAVIDDQKPDVILCFGKIAEKGLRQLDVAPHIGVLYSVHPASRGTLQTLSLLASSLKVLIVDRERVNGTH